jgi:ATPase subunit of ABC transporter with duplicated ATPase domains
MNASGKVRFHGPKGSQLQAMLDGFQKQQKRIAQLEDTVARLAATVKRAGRADSESERAARGEQASAPSGRKPVASLINSDNGLKAGRLHFRKHDSYKWNRAALGPRGVLFA